MVPGATCFSPDALQVTIRKQPCALYREPPAARYRKTGRGLGIRCGLVGAKRNCAMQCDLAGIRNDVLLADSAAAFGKHTGRGAVVQETSNPNAAQRFLNQRYFVLG